MGLNELIVGALPPHIKRLALWGAGDPNDEYRTGVLRSVGVKAKAGEYMAGDTPAWVSPGGTKFPISPGATVYKTPSFGTDTYLVTGPPKLDGTPASARVEVEPPPWSRIILHSDSEPMVYVSNNNPFKRTTSYRKAERAAKAAPLGIWKTCR